ncbi:sigma factor-like helix-turn-helix DNA-binding protein [Streptomyces zaomyceticus]|uniref:sigma factor-like helix-turn-helix DNA-binding protein n=1 Tax=Streptomyces zaomyceticus TaxID=68286 RepID=UPI0033BA3DAA
MTTSTPAAARGTTEIDPEQDPRYAAQRAEDAELFALLQLHRFEGPHFEMLQDRLFRYGWRVLRKWMRDGEIVERCRERRVYFKAPYTEVEELMRRDDIRQDIAIDCMHRALPEFMSDQLLTWTPDGGRGLNTYFLHFALWKFRDAYREWASEHRRRMREILGPDAFPAYRDVIVDWDPWERRPVPGPENQTVLQETLSTILAAASMEERAVCEAMLTAGGTQEEIAEQLGTTRKSVERRLHRVRRRAHKLAAAGTIVTPSVSSAVVR